jgi:hypothetical protein
MYNYQEDFKEQQMYGCMSRGCIIVKHAFFNKNNLFADISQQAFVLS